jgi:hypothetical protein
MACSIVLWFNPNFSHIVVHSRVFSSYLLYAATCNPGLSSLTILEYTIATTAR